MSHRWVVQIFVGDREEVAEELRAWLELAEDRLVHDVDGHPALMISTGGPGPAGVAVTAVTKVHDEEESRGAPDFFARRWGAAIAVLLLLAGCAPQVSPRTESGFLPPDLCSAIGWPGAFLGIVVTLAVMVVALYWIWAHYQPGS
ncbi:MAG: hypothetical protein GY898_23180 [Proteobacteria bacterium]|nr:hypothetical protein [Pseudomonadota bacterium]